MMHKGPIHSSNRPLPAELAVCWTGDIYWLGTAQPIQGRRRHAYLSVSLPKKYAATFERTETISEHGTAKPQCSKCEQEGFRCAALASRRPRADIGRYDLLDWFRLNLELLETWQAPTRDIVRLEKVNLPGGERWVGQELE